MNPFLLFGIAALLAMALMAVWVLSPRTAGREMRRSPRAEDPLPPAPMNGGTVMLGADGRVRAWNGAISELLELPPESVNGRRWNEMLDELTVRERDGLLRLSSMDGARERWLQCERGEPAPDGRVLVTVRDRTPELHRRQDSLALLRRAVVLATRGSLPPAHARDALDSVLGHVVRLMGDVLLAVLEPGSAGDRLEVLARQRARGAPGGALPKDPALLQRVLSGSTIGPGGGLMTAILLEGEPVALLYARNRPGRWPATDRTILEAAAELVALLLQRRREWREGRGGDEAGELARRSLESMDDGFVLLDDVLRIVYMNPTAGSWLTLMGRSSEAFQGRSLEEAVPEISDTAVPGHLRKAVATQNPVDFVYDVERARKSLEVHVHPSGGGVAVHVRDVTDRRATEQALAESEARFRTVVESLGEGLMLTGTEGTVLYINQRMTELTGFRPEQVIGKQAHEVLAPEEAWPANRARREELLEGRPAHYRTTLLTREDGRVHVEVHASPLRNARGEVVGSVDAVTDITERLAAEEALRRSEERYRNHFQNDVAGNFIADPDGVVLTCNRAFAQIFGYGATEEAEGERLLGGLWPDDPERKEALRQEGRLEYLEAEVTRPDGSPLHVIANLRGLRNGDGELREVRGHLIDITHQKVLAEQLRQAQKMEAVGRLAGGGGARLQQPPHRHLGPHRPPHAGRPAGHSRGRRPLEDPASHGQGGRPHQPAPRLQQATGLPAPPPASGRGRGRADRPAPASPGRADPPRDLHRRSGVGGPGGPESARAGRDEPLCEQP